jgi:hypothetical protein
MYIIDILSETVIILQEEGTVIPHYRHIVYSYLDLMTLLDKVAKLSKSDRNAIKKSKLINQQKILKIKFAPKLSLKIRQLDFALRVCSKYELAISKFNEDDVATLLYIFKNFP